MSKLPEIIADLQSLLDVDAPAFIWGAPGVGKSEAVAQVAATRGANVTDIRLSTFDPVDLRGLPMVDLERKVTAWMRPQIWPVETGRETVLFFDEMDRAAPAVANAALQIVLDRRIGEFELPASVRIVAAGNGATDARTTSKIGSAQANRFTHLYVEADADAAAAHWASKGRDPALSAFIRFRSNLIQTAPAAGEHGFASPRAWEKCDRFMHLPDAQRARLIKGTVGEAPAMEFEAFVRMFRNLPSIDAIIRDPSGAPVSADISVNYAVASALSRKATHQNFAAICTYLQRMPREFDIACVTDATRRDAGLTQVRAYAEWAARNQDVSL